MNSTLTSYPSYRSSGASCLGDVPAHWRVAKLGMVGVFFKGSGGTKDDEVADGIPCVRYGDLYTTHARFIRQTRSYVSPARASAYTPIDIGDVLFPTSGETIDEIGKSAVNLMHTQVVCGGDLIIFRPTIPMEPMFAGYALDCPAAQTQKSLMGRGITIMHIYSSQLKYLWVPLPPLPEQTAIVRYLDHVDRRIRRYLSAKRKLIALLEEEKQAVINQAVTRGLDPNVRLKPSGVEWLGDVPEHWEVRRVGHFSKVGNGSTPSRGNAAYWTDGIHPWLNSSSVNQGVITSTDQFVTDLALRECHLPRLHPGSVLVGITGQGKTRGMSAVLAINATINQHMAFITPKAARVSPHYLHMCLTAAYSELRAISGASGSTKAALTCEDVKRFMVVLPLRDEQERLLSKVGRETASINAAIVRTRQQIELIEEYRTRLIADVVTGKLDVRAAAAWLPDEPGDADGIDVDGVAEDLGGELARADAV